MNEGGGRDRYIYIHIYTYMEIQKDRQIKDIISFCPAPIQEDLDNKILTFLWNILELELEAGAFS